MCSDIVAGVCLRGSFIEPKIDTPNNKAPFNHSLEIEPGLSFLLDPCDSGPAGAVGIIADRDDNKHTLTVFQINDDAPQITLAQLVANDAIQLPEDIARMGLLCGGKQKATDVFVIVPEDWTSWDTEQRKPLFKTPHFSVYEGSVLHAIAEGEPYPQEMLFVHGMDVISYQKLNRLIRTYETDIATLNSVEDIRDIVFHDPDSLGILPPKSKAASIAESRWGMAHDCTFFGIDLTKRRPMIPIVTANARRYTM